MHLDIRGRISIAIGHAQDTVFNYLGTVARGRGAV